MNDFKVNVEKRVAAGKGALTKLKKEGMVPGILYGKGENIPVSLNNHEIKTIIDKNGEDVFFDLNLNGKQIKSKIKEMQRDPLTREIKHIDFMQADSSVLH